MMYTSSSPSNTQLKHTYFSLLGISLWLCASFNTTVLAQTSPTVSLATQNTSTPIAPLPLIPSSPNEATDTVEQTTENALTNEKFLIEQGRYLTRAANCYSCHTQDHQAPYAGGAGIITPLGTIYPTNITPDIQTGIGSWSDEEFYRALHEGIGKKGQHLYPVMPYDAYTGITLQDAKAIKAYLSSVPAIQRRNQAHELQFPYNYRYLLHGWKVLNFHEKTFQPNPNKSQTINRGTYLATALAHCGTCHTPRTLTMASDPNRALAGAAIAEGWYAPNITPDSLSGIGKWTDAELTQYLRTGAVSGKAHASGPMSQVIQYALAGLNNEDTSSIVSWLRDQNLIRNNAERQPTGARSRFEWGQQHDFSAQARSTLDYTNPLKSSEEAHTPQTLQLYYGACASCHGVDGSGVAQTGFPALAGNTSLGLASPNNVIMTILNGVDRKIGNDHIFMPSFKDQLTDEEIMHLSNWLFMQYGRPISNIPVEQIRDLRAGVAVGEAPIAAAIKATLVAISALSIIFALGWSIRLSPRIKAFFANFKRKRQKASSTAKV